MLREIPLFWWGKNSNFGDAINPFIVHKLTKNKVVRSGIKTTEPFYMAIGSILNLATDKAIVWGSGLIARDKLYKSKPLAIHAVRGPLTRKKLIDAGCSCPLVYGDPALLLPRLYKPKIKKKYNLGILPHYIDKEHPWVLDAKRRGYNVINITNPDPIEVLNHILQCKHIVTSSLHGLIVSDAYGIPNTWVTFSDKLMGGTFKFEDYFASVRKPRKAIDLRMQKKAILYPIMGSMNGNPININLEKLVKACPMF